MPSSRIIRRETIGVDAKAELQKLTALISRESRQLALAERTRREVGACRRGVEMTSAAIHYPGCPATVLPNLPELASAERLSTYRALWQEFGLLRVVRGGSIGEIEPCRLSRHGCHATGTPRTVSAGELSFRHGLPPPLSRASCVRPVNRLGCARAILHALWRCAEKGTLDNVSNQRKPGCRRGGV